MAPCNWEVDPAALGVCSDWSGYDAAVRATALDLATTYVWSGTGRRFGLCPVTVRPAQARRGELAYQEFAVQPGTEGLGVPGGPYLFGGRWFNSGCATACCGNQACAVVLRGPVAAVDTVTVDGDVVPASAYRVDVSRGTWLLVRIDGECWPACQDFTREPDQENTFEVTYDRGEPVPEPLKVAVALLACEHAKSLTGGACALPARMTRLSRQGVEVEVEPPSPADGLTGITVVDNMIRTYNPGKRQRPPVILSPDQPESCDRYTAVPAGS